MIIEKKEIDVSGKFVLVDTVQIDNKQIVFEGKFPKYARMMEEEYENLEDPQVIIAALKKLRRRPDIFTFCQRLPDIDPKYNFHMEWDSVAAIRIENYEHWWNRQINDKTRNLVRKAQKKGVVVKKSEFTDDFVNGMVSIFNESPVRQGKPFWHYGKNFDVVKSQFSRFLHREDIYGAYHNGELIGFIMLAYAGSFATLGMIISKIEHRDKAANNALIAKAVEVCAEKKIPYLVYAKWADGSLGEFKRHNAFEKVNLPRYYVPLTVNGYIALKLKLHRRVAEILPQCFVAIIKNYRRKWYQRKSCIVKTT